MDSVECLWTNHSFSCLHCISSIYYIYEPLISSHASISNIQYIYIKHNQHKLPLGQFRPIPTLVTIVYLIYYIKYNKKHCLWSPQPVSVVKAKPLVVCQQSIRVVAVYNLYIAAYKHHSITQLPTHKQFKIFRIIVASSPTVKIKKLQKK